MWRLGHGLFDLPCDVSCSGDIDFDLLGDTQKKDARVLEAPFDVRNRDVARRDYFSTAQRSPGFDDCIVLSALQYQYTYEFRSEIPLRIYVAVDALRSKHDFRPPCRLEYAIPHAIVAKEVAALAGCSINDDFALGLIRPVIDLDYAAFELEPTVRGV